MSRKGGLPTGFRGAEASQPHLFRNPLHKCCTRKAKRPTAFVQRASKLSL